MANPIAIPGTVVPSGSLTTPGGAQGVSGPTAVSTDAGNIAKLGTDSLILVPLLPKIGGYLAYVSATQLSFLPYNGAGIQINGTLYTIPSSGIVGLASTNVFVNGVAGQNLAYTTLYYVYCFNNGGTLTGDFSTTGHAISSTAGNQGTEIKSGDDTRTLLGMVQTGNSSIFYDSTNFRYTRSWVNRRRIGFNNSLVTGTLTATTATSLLSVTVLCFAGETIDMCSSGRGYMAAAGVFYIANYIEGALVGQLAACNVSAASFNAAFGLSWAVQPMTEALHTLATYGYVSAGTATLTFNLTGSIGG